MTTPGSCPPVWRPFVLLPLIAIGQVSACAARPSPTIPAFTLAQSPVTVLAVPSMEQEVVVMVAAGSAYDPPGREGLAWQTAALIGLSAGVTPRVGPELVVFRAPVDRVEELSASLVNPPIDAAWLAAVPPPAWEQDCARIASAALDMALYPGHPYGHPAFGRTSTRHTVSPAEIQAFHRRRYVRPAVAAAAADPAVFGARLDGLPASLSSPVTPTILPDRILPDQRGAGPTGKSGATAQIVTAPVSAPCIALGARDGLPSTAEDLASLELLRAWWGDERGGEPRRPGGFRVIVPDLLDSDGLSAVLSTLARVQQAGVGEELGQARERILPRLRDEYAEELLAQRLVPGAADRRGIGDALGRLTVADLDQRLRVVVPAFTDVHLVLVSPAPGGLQSGGSQPVSRAAPLEEDPERRVPQVIKAEELFR